MLMDRITQVSFLDAEKRIFAGENFGQPGIARPANPCIPALVTTAPERTEIGLPARKNRLVLNVEQPFRFPLRTWPSVTRRTVDKKTSSETAVTCEAMMKR
jgi:hypothetical protein